MVCDSTLISKLLKRRSRGNHGFQVHSSWNQSNLGLSGCDLTYHWNPSSEMEGLVGILRRGGGSSLFTLAIPQGLLGPLDVLLPVVHNGQVVDLREVPGQGLRLVRYGHYQVSK